LYTSCVLDCALRFLMIFLLLIKKKKKKKEKRKKRKEMGIAVHIS
jgi:DMSO/TMAO reductase YedYZ heme-binding membrane subunit